MITEEILTGTDTCFNELSAYNTLIAEGLFQEFSNSFLLIASERGTN